MEKTNWIWKIRDSDKIYATSFCGINIIFQTTTNSNKSVEFYNFSGKQILICSTGESFWLMLTFRQPHTIWLRQGKTISCKQNKKDNLKYSKSTT